MQKRVDYHVPAREGKAFRVSKGERVKVIDLRGGQAANLFAYNVDNGKEYLSAEHTRPSANPRSYPSTRLRTCFKRLSTSGPTTQRIGSVIAQ